MREENRSRLTRLMLMGDALLNHRDEAVPRDDVRQLLIDFLKTANYSPLATPIFRPNTWFRARFQSSSQQFEDHLSELLYPLRPSKTWGRASSPGERVLYAGWNAPTAVAEIDLTAPGNVWLTHIRPKSATQVIGAMIGAYEHCHRSGRPHYPSASVSAHMERFFSETSDEYALNIILYADMVLAKLLRSSGVASYHVTSALADLLYDRERYAVFLYPSVQAASSINIAIKEDVFDGAFEVLAVERIQVEFDLGSGLILSSSKHVCHDFSKDGFINWYSQKRNRSEFSLQAGLHYSPDVTGWSVPANWLALKEKAAA